MYSVNGSTWQVLSTNAHASNILANMNAQLQAQGLPIVTATVGNILWFFCLAAGQEIANNVDAPLLAAKNSFSIANCDANQIYSLLPLTGTTLIPASYSTMNVIFTASNTGSLIITSGMHVTVSGLSNKFITQTGATIPANTSATIATVADTSGPIIVVSGQVNGMVESLANFGSVQNQVACAVGSAIETATQARARILAGNTVGNNLNGVILAIRGLPGVTGANVYFNNGLTSMVLSGATSSGVLTPITLPARTSYIVVQGGSANIASTYWGSMTAPTLSGLNNTVESIVTLSNQTININYDTAVPYAIYLKVYIQQSTIINSSYASLIYSALAAIQPPMGGTVTSQYILTYFANFLPCTVQGILLSIDEINYSVAINVPSNAYGVFTQARTTLVLQ